MHQRFKEAENKNSTQFNTIAALREEIETLKKGLFEEKETRRKLQAEADTNKSQFLDMQRTERVVRIDLEQAQKTVNSFKILYVFWLFVSNLMMVKIVMFKSVQIYFEVFTCLLKFKCWYTDTFMPYHTHIQSTHTHSYAILIYK